MRRLRLTLPGVPVVLALLLNCDESPSQPTFAPPNLPQQPQALTITSVTPTSGSIDGATVTIRGTGFTTGMTATIGGAPVTPAVVSSVEMTLTAPPHAEGPVDLIVTRASGETARLMNAYTYRRLAVTEVTPNVGIIGQWVRVSGFGFDSGLVVMFGTQQAKLLVQGTTVMALAPPNDPGAVEVAVINPSGSRATLSAGYTYQLVTLTVGPAVVPVRGTLSVSWAAPLGHSPDDWIGLFRVGARNEEFLWYSYVGNASSGLFTTVAPSEPGEYDFRYLADDGYNDAVRSAPIRVTP